MRIFNTPYRFRYVSLVWLLVLTLVACTSSGAQPIATSVVPTSTPLPPPTGRGIGDTLQLTAWESPTTLNPYIGVGLKDFFASRIVYEPLASFDKDGALIPFLAAEIPSLENGGVAADGRSVTWKLKQGVQWSDGKPFTAADVKFTYEFITNDKIRSPAAGSYEAVEDVTIIDDYTVRVNFKDPNPAWATPFVGRQGLIIPRHMFEDYNGANVRDAPANMMPVGTGSYRVVSFKPQEVVFLGTDLVRTNKIVYEPNPFFREPDKPYFSRVELRGGGTTIQAARAVLEAGTTDFAYNLQINDADIDAMGATDRGKLEETFGSTLILIELNATDPTQGSIRDFPHPILSDLQVRQAINVAINREAIANSVYGRFARPISNILIAPEIYQSPNTAYEFNLEAAARLLDAAGWTDTDGDGVRDKDGVRLRLIYQSALNPRFQAIQQMVEDDLEAVGIEVVSQVIDPSDFYGGDPANPRTVEKFAADIQQYDTPSPTPDPGPYLGYWTCGQIPQPDNWSGFNSARWCNATYDALYAQSQTELDADQRRDIFIQMNDILVADRFMLPIVRLANVSGVSNELEGIELTPWDAETWNIKDWRRQSSS